MNAKKLYEVLIANWSPAKIETLELLIKHGPLTIVQIGTLRNRKPIHLTDSFGVMYKNGLIGFDPDPTLKIIGDLHISSYLKRKNIIQNTKILSKISLEEFNAFKKYSDEAKKQKKIKRKKIKASRYIQSSAKYIQCWAQDCENNEKSTCNAIPISLIKISVSFKGKPIIIVRCLGYKKA